jgi:hypothetical protein
MVNAGNIVIHIRLMLVFLDVENVELDLIGSFPHPKGMVIDWLMRRENRSRETRQDYERRPMLAEDQYRPQRRLCRMDDHEQLAADGCGRSVHQALYAASQPGEGRNPDNNPYCLEKILCRSLVLIR